MRLSEIIETYRLAVPSTDRPRGLQIGTAEDGERLTLRKLNQLKKIRDAERALAAEQDAFIVKMYGNDDDAIEAALDRNISRARLRKIDADTGLAQARTADVLVRP